MKNIRLKLTIFIALAIITITLYWKERIKIIDNFFPRIATKINVELINTAQQEYFEKYGVFANSIEVLTKDNPSILMKTRCFKFKIDSDRSVAIIAADPGICNNHQGVYFRGGVFILDGKDDRRTKSILCEPRPGTWLNPRYEDGRVICSTGEYPISGRKPI